MADNKPPCLTVLGGPMAGNRFILQDGVPNILVGSDPVCAFHLPLPGVSAMHARIAVEPGGVTLCEAGSNRGLHVNDSKVEGSAPLRNGDIIWLGTPGEADVVMLQCILPRTPSVTAEEAPAETEMAPGAVEGDTVRLDPQALSLDSFSAPLPAEAPVSPDLSAPLPLMVESPPEEPEEAGVVVVDSEAETFIRGPEAVEALDTPAASAADHTFVLADEGMPLTVEEPPRSYPPQPPAPVVTTPLMPPGFEDETEERLIEAAPLVVSPEPHEVEPTAFLPTSDLAPPPAPQAPAVAPSRVTPPAATVPAPAPAAARPATPARPARPTTPTPARKPPAPSVSQRTEPTAKPATPPAPKATSSSSTGLYVGIGVGALVVLGAGGFALLKFLPKKGAQAVVTATPPPPVGPTAPAVVHTPASGPTEAPPIIETPPPVTPTPTPLPTAPGKPTPSPSPTKPGATPTPATPTPATVAAPAGPSPEQVRAQQVAGLLGQGDAALNARNYDQAVGFFDEALKLEPGNAKATADRATAIAGRDMGRRRFVAGRTVVTTEKAAGGGISGFEGAAVQKAPDFLGRIEFEMSPASGLKAGDPWTLKLYVVNEGKKAIRITDLTATAVVNGERSGGAASAKAREIAPQGRVQVAEMAGAWKDGTQSWSAEVLVTAKGDSLKNSLTWK